MDPAIIAGLGNPGPAYAGTRHNMGFALVEALAAHAQVSLQSDSRLRTALAKATLQNRLVWLAQPLTFMNNSGQAIQPLCQFYKIPPERLLVIYDDITLAPGAVKLSSGGGNGGHNGITSILQHLPNSFHRLRIGIGPKQFPGQDLADHVLGKLTSTEQALFLEKLPFYIQGVNLWLSQALAIAQNFINKKASS